MYLQTNKTVHRRVLLSHNIVSFTGFESSGLYSDEKHFFRRHGYLKPMCETFFMVKNRRVNDSSRTFHRTVPRGRFTGAGTIQQRV